MNNKMFFLITAAVLFVSAISSCNKGDSVSVTGITLDPSSVILEVGESIRLTASVTPDDADNPAFNWNSGNNAVAKVDKDGYVTAVEEGDTEITVTTQDGKFTQSCSVTVIRKIPITALTIDPSSVRLSVGEEFVLKAIVTPNNADNQTLIWDSDNKAVATVDQNGVVTAVADGEAEITVTTEDGDHSATCAVTVIKRMTMTTEDINVSIRLKGIGTAIIDWGDGEDEQTVTLSPIYSDCNKIYTNTISRTITIYGNITDLVCAENRLTNLDVSKNTELIYLSCRNNNLTTLDVTACTQLEQLYCQNSPLLEELLLNDCSALKIIYCDHSALTSLNVEGCVSLFHFFCNDNQLSETALNDLFDSLHNITLTDEKIIDVSINPGTATCDVNKAEDKGWTVIKEIEE